MLSIKKLTLKNVGVYKGTRDILFDDGLNIIQATNGKGKSTAIQMIEMLITNQYEGSFSDYINDDSNEMSASLTFEYNNNQFNIVLTCKRGKSSSERILYNASGDKLASGEDAISYISEMFDPVLTQYSLVAKQKPIDNIVTCKDSERRDLFKKIKEINLEKYVKLHVEPIISKLKNEIVLLEKELYRLEHAEYDYKKEVVISTTEIEIIAKREELKELQSKQNLIEKEKIEYEQKTKELSEIKNLLTQSEILLTRKSSLLHECEESIKKMESQEYKDEQITKLKDNFTKEKSALELDVQSINEKIKNFEHTFEINKIDLNKVIETIDKQLLDIKISKIAKFDDTELKRIEDDISKTKQDIKHCDINIKSLEKGICPTCGEKCEHKLQEYVSLKQSYELSITELCKLLSEENDRKVSHEKLISDNEESKLKKQRLVSEKELLLSKIESTTNKFNADVSNSKSLIADKQKQITNITSKYESSIKDIDENGKRVIEKEKSLLVEYKNDVFNLITEIDNRKSVLAELEKKVNNFSLSSEDYNDKIIPIQNEIKLYESTIISNDIIRNNNKILDDKKKQDLIDLEEVKKNIIISKKDLFNHEQARTILLKDFPNYIIDASIEDVEAAMNEFIDTIYYKSLNIELRATKTSIKMEYGLGDQKLPSHRLSGAESKIVSLAFIHYFNTMIGLQCIILDEPDSALNIVIAEQLYESLLQMNQIYKQMIIVTHNERMKNYMIANAQTNIIEL